ncbi:hypothetical protein D4A92_14305 [Rhizobium rosettiformans]|uniref:Lytic murein transglycosylase n=1 Tax=Rhizobium rosettiformans TaxID=1368430 RepID=A0ABX7EW09_9HYPH|nr:hypothetical protein D4A92_14305 [Rhizobium rosettiformans]
MLAPVVTPLWPAGHLPHKGGERIAAAARAHPPLEGEGRSETPGWGDWLRVTKVATRRTRGVVHPHPPLRGDLPPQGGGGERNARGHYSPPLWGRCHAVTEGGERPIAEVLVRTTA